MWEISSRSFVLAFYTQYRQPVCIKVLQLRWKSHLARGSSLFAGYLLQSLVLRVLLSRRGRVASKWNWKAKLRRPTFFEFRLKYSFFPVFLCQFRSHSILSWAVLTFNIEKETPIWVDHALLQRRRRSEIYIELLNGVILIYWRTFVCAGLIATQWQTQTEVIHFPCALWVEYR